VHVDVSNASLTVCEPDVDTILAICRSYRQHVRDLLPPGIIAARRICPPDPASALAQGDVMPGKGRASRRFEACKARAYHQHLFGIVLADALYVDTYDSRVIRGLTTQLVATVRSCRARYVRPYSAAVGEAFRIS